MSAANHIIDRMRVEVVARERRRAASAQQELAFGLHTSGFLQKLAQLFDDLVPDGDYLEIDHLQLRFNYSNAANISDALLAELRLELRRQVDTRAKGLKKIGREAFYRQVASDFLLSGALFYPEGQEALDAFKEKLRKLPEQDDPPLEKLIADAATGTPLVWERVFFLLGASGMMRYCRRVFPASIPSIPDAPFFSPAVTHEQSNASASRWQDAAYWSTILSAPVVAVAAINTTTPVTTATATTAPPMARPLAAGAVPSDLPSHTIRSFPDTGVAIGNAGIVLLWMAFAQLLRTLGYLQEKLFGSAVAQRHAILLLHYLCWGDVEIAEEELVLNKLLCAWPLQEPLDLQDLPSENDRRAADEMFDAYLADWKKDRKYSKEWFRATFLQREGRLGQRPDGHWNLTIEKKTEDVILNKTSVIRYSWMQHMLFVQW